MHIFRTVFALTILVVSLSILAESRIVHKAKYVRVLRETEESSLPKTQLADGTRFEKYAEKGEELPPLPVGEEEADSLDDPRIGRFKDGEITVPVDDNGKVLPGYEYLLKPFNVVIDLDEKDTYEEPKVYDAYNIGTGVKTDGKDKEQVYNPYPNPVHPKPEMMPEKGETEGAEYDDVVSEPREPVPDVPELPKLDYSDSGESDEDMKMEEEVEEKEGERIGGGVVPVEERRDEEIIIPSSVIEKAKDIKETVEEEREDNKENSSITQEEKEENEEAERTAEIAEKVADRIEETLEEEAESVGLTEEDVQQLANEFREELYDKVINNAGAFKEWGSEDNEAVDPNSIVAELPREPELPSIPIIEAEPLDGVILPGEDLTDEEIAEIEKESEKSSEESEVISNPSEPVVRGGRIGSGVKPDSASSFNVFLQFLVSAVLLLLL